MLRRYFVLIKWAPSGDSCTAHYLHYLLTRLRPRSYSRWSTKKESNDFKEFFLKRNIFQEFFQKLKKFWLTDCSIVISNDKIIDDLHDCKKCYVLPTAHVHVWLGSHTKLLTNLFFVRRQRSFYSVFSCIL